MLSVNSAVNSYNSVAAVSPAAGVRRADQPTEPPRATPESAAPSPRPSVVVNISVQAREQLERVAQSRPDTDELQAQGAAAAATAQDEVANASGPQTPEPAEAQRKDPVRAG